MAWVVPSARRRTIQNVFALLTFALFLATFLQWRGVPVFGDELPFRPFSSLCTSAGLLCIALSPLAMRRSNLLAGLLLAASLAALWFGFTTR